jgi:hypothetical protein
MLLIFDPETPGGLRLSMACRADSSSVTADDMMLRRDSLRAGIKCQTLGMEQIRSASCACTLHWGSRVRLEVFLDDH